MRLTKYDIKRKTVGGLPFTIPKGALCELASFTNGAERCYWVHPSMFHPDSIERHDATYYGVTVLERDTEEV